MKTIIEKHLGKLKKFRPHVTLNRIGNCIEINLEDCSYHAEWIKGEGGDISIYRANDNDRVVGALLPLPKNTKTLPVYYV